MQGVDEGVFTLSVFSTIEAYLRETLGNEVSRETRFNELVEKFRSRHSRHNPKEYKLFKDIKSNHFNTNEVRHRFGNLSLEEANAATYLLKEFSSIFNLPNQDAVAALARNLSAWDNRRSPAETAMELEKANRKLELLSRQNDDMAGKVSQMDEAQKELEKLESQLNAMRIDYEQQIEKNKKDKAKIDELRQKKHSAEEEGRKAQKELREQLAKLSDAQEYIANLRRMASYTKTRYDYEQSLVRLTAEQESIVKQVNFGHDFLVKGSAGTGKSLVLLKTLEKLILENESQLFKERNLLALVTFSRSLEKYNRYVASLMNIHATDAADGAASGSTDKNMIMTSESFLCRILKDAFPGVRTCYGTEKCLEDSPCVRDNPLGKEIWPELEKLILPSFVTKEKYYDGGYSRTGMKKPLKSEQRVKVWEAVDAIFAEWEKKESQSVPYLTYKLLRKISSGEYSIPEQLMVDYLFVDEAQDLTAASLRVLKLSTRKSMILAGDGDQSVFQPGFTWSQAGIDVSGRTRILHTNFRSTDQINAAAERYRALIKGCDPDNAPQTFRMGPPVELHEDATEDKSFSSMVGTVRMCMDMLGYEPENICLIAPQKKQLDKLQSLLKDTLGLESKTVNSDDFDFARPGVVRLATMQSCKGLDFPVVLFYIDHRAHFLSMLDDSVADKMNRNMIYTAMTRAIELLHVFMPEKVSEGPVGDLKSLLKEREKTK